jgi:glycosyltransferase involved in cell wall biosynthesis
VVDDGSSDRTAELVRAQPGATLVQHAKNGGYGAALKTGFAAATGEWVGFLDADGTYPPEYFPALIKAAKEQDADLVIGSRMAGAESQMPVTRRIGNLIFARLVNIISASKITDSASGMRIFKKSILAQLYPLPDGLEPDAGDEHARAARTAEDDRGADSLQRAHRPFQAERRA